MIKNGIPALVFPDIEKLLKIPKNEEIEFTVFETPLKGTKGVFTVNTYGRKTITFELLESFFSGENNFQMKKRVTKKDYKELCVYAQNCYNRFIIFLMENHDCSDQWEDYK